MYYDPFTTALHEVVKDFKLPVNELGYFVTRIEEEHLWESKQLGAHSPQVCVCFSALNFIILLAKLLKSYLNRHFDVIQFNVLPTKDLNMIFIFSRYY